jgi:tRNA (adenine37-N6)-methyltransferase
MSAVVFHPIGTIHSPFKTPAGMPIQPAGARNAAGRVEVDAAYGAGLDDIEGFSHIILIYHFHRSEGFDLTVTPFLDQRPHGLFATRAPRRPNPIGISVVPLLRREGNVLHVDCIDVLDGTPLLDIKPFVPDFDAPEATAVGWLAGKQGEAEKAVSDARFSQPDPS